MQKSDQKLVIIYGSHNSGKTLLYNLFKKEDKFICLDFHKPHYDIHKQNIIDQIGKKNAKRIEKFILSSKMLLIDYFFEEVGYLMEQFPEYNFVIKPGNHTWIVDYKQLFGDWIYYIDRFTPLELKNIIHLHVIRHPKICLATSYDHNTNIKVFIDRWISDYQYLKSAPDVYKIIKIEDIKEYNIIQTLIKNTDLENLTTYTKYDLNEYRTNIFDRMDHFKSDLKVIEKKLKMILNYLKYDVEDENTLFYLEELKIKQLEFRKNEHDLP